MFSGALVFACIKLNVRGLVICFEGGSVDRVVIKRKKNEQCAKNKTTTKAKKSEKHDGKEEPKSFVDFFFNQLVFFFCFWISGCRG